MFSPTTPSPEMSVTNDPLQPPVEINSLETLQQARYTVWPRETHVAVISILLWLRTWGIITIKLPWISRQRGRRGRYFISLPFQQIWARGFFSFSMENKTKQKSDFQLIQENINITENCTAPHNRINEVQRDPPHCDRNARVTHGAPGLRFSIRR